MSGSVGVGLTQLPAPAKPERRSMGAKVERRDTEEFKVTLIEPAYQEEPSVYDLKYLVYRLDLQKQLGLNDMETKLLSFILSFSQVSDRFYFGNESLGKLFDKHVNTISSTVSSLESKGLIECSRQIMAGGGEIRFIRLTAGYEQGSQKSVSEAHRKLGENNNKINNNKINTISKDMVVDHTKRYGNKEVQDLRDVLVKNYPKALEGVVDNRKLYNLIQVLTPRKNQDEWMKDLWRDNFKGFMKTYLQDTEEKYLVGSVDKLREKAKLWREYRGKLN